MEVEEAGRIEKIKHDKRFINHAHKRQIFAGTLFALQIRGRLCDDVYEESNFVYELFCETFDLDIDYEKFKTSILCWTKHSTHTYIEVCKWR